MLWVLDQIWGPKATDLALFRMESTSPQPNFCEMQPQFYKAFWAGGLSSAHLWPLPPGTLCVEGSLGRSPMARCSLFGDDFISTFDESMYSFAGDCSYLLAGDCQKHSFSLIGESWALNGGIGSGSQLSSARACGGLRGRGGFLTTVPALEDPAENTVGNGLSITQGSPWLLRGSLHGAWWDGESSCFSSDCGHCSGSGQHSGSSKHQEKWWSRRCFVTGKAPSTRQGSLCVLGGIQSITLVSSTSCVLGKVLVLCPCHLCSPTVVPRCRDRYNHSCLANGELTEVVWFSDR